MKAELVEQIQSKEKQLKQMKSQRDSLLREIQQLKNGDHFKSGINDLNSGEIRGINYQDHDDFMNNSQISHNSTDVKFSDRRLGKISKQSTEKFAKESKLMSLASFKKPTGYASGIRVANHQETAQSSIGKSIQNPFLKKSINLRESARSSQRGADPFAEMLKKFENQQDKTAAT